MKYLIIGNGVAGTTAAETIRKQDANGKITIISNEKLRFYSRIKLIDLLSGDIDEEGLLIKEHEWYEKNHVNLILNDPAETIDKEAKVAHTGTGKEISYDKLLLATGSNSFIPPIPGSDKCGVFTLRNIKNALAIKKYCFENAKDVVVIGGGVLGLEAGNALRKKGHNITVIEALSRLLPRQMDPAGSEILQRQMERMGFTFHISRLTKEIVGEEKVEGVLLDDGTEISCEVVVISAGVRPELTLAKQLELNIDKGVMVDDHLCTNNPDVYAAGDLVNHRGRLYGIWPAAKKQGEIAGANMAGGNGNIRYESTTISNVLKVAGIDLVAIGEIDGNDEFESIVKKDPENNIYKKMVIEDNKLIGAILLGDKKNWFKLQSAIESGIDISEIKDELAEFKLEIL